MDTPPHENENLNPFRRTTRSALAEIPARMGMLNMYDIPTPVTPATVLMNMPDTSILGQLNIPDSFNTPSPSPDELVIQQRGRRRIPVTWSPDVEKRAPDRQDKTPIKNLQSPSKSNIVLRSTPRKRLLLNDFKDVPGSPDKLKKLSPNSKRSKLESPVSLPRSKCLRTALKGLSQDQLIEMIIGITQKNPVLECEIKECFPAPDIFPLEEKLNYLKKNIFKSLPNNRLSSKTDSSAYSRAATHVNAFKKCVVDQCRTLVESEHWEAVMEYIIRSWQYVLGTPLWDNPPHNASRKYCFKYLSSQCMTALRKGVWAPEQYDYFLTKLATFGSDSEDMQMCVKYLNSIKKKV